jgi:hypothetical protein
MALAKSSAWRARTDILGEDQRPVYEAGIANLTKDATPILVHSRVTAVRIAMS